MVEAFLGEAASLRLLSAEGVKWKIWVERGFVRAGGIEVGGEGRRMNSGWSVIEEGLEVGEEDRRVLSNAEGDSAALSLMFRG